jgi:hypothetical protein
MAIIDIGFEWSRGHAYECVPSKTGMAIRQIGKGKSYFEPLKVPLDSGLAVTFANLDLDFSAEKCVGFAHSFGLLTLPARIGAAESLDDWRRKIKEMRSLISMTGMVRTANSRRVRMNITRIQVALESGLPDTKPALILQPETLFDAMKLQWAQSKKSGSSVYVCEYCDKWFERGGEAKRSDAKFCSDPCRNKFHYEQRRAGK